MRKLELSVRFNTPAFLGNAEQSGQWRTPPFKALLRQWWRIAAANGFGYDSERLREAEGRLFGTAADGESRQSAIRLRLDRWNDGKLKSAHWPGKEENKCTHPEVTNKEGKAMPVGTELYLGYGPLTYSKEKKQTTLKGEAAIQPNESAKLCVAWPESEAAMADALKLIHWFGSIGGRSRNGWGSLAFDDGVECAEIPDASDPLIGRIAMPLDRCLTRDWPHALGKDARGLMIWKSQHEFPTWRDAMTALAKAKIGFRTSLKFTGGKNGPFEDRHLLAYPVTNHNVGKLPREARLANQLRFKVARTANGKFVAVIFHLPCALPHELAQKLGPSKPSPEQQAAIWSRVHAWLDTPASGFQRI
jgi:CRISPR-associated protein Cmr1